MIPFSEIQELAECDGRCSINQGCVGEIQRVRVSGRGEYWGEFNYCQTAIDIDRGNGLIVKVIEGGKS